MDKYEVLYAAKAAEKEIGKRVKALETECKREVLDAYGRDGIDRKRSTVFGSKNAYITVQEGKPSEEAERFDVIDIQALTDWMDETRPDTDCFAADNLAAFAEWHFRSTGEMPDGCRLLRYRTEEKPPIAKLIVKDEPVLEAVSGNPELSSEVGRFLLGDADNPLLGGASQLMLGDGDD